MSLSSGGCPGACSCSCCSSDDESFSGWGTLGVVWSDGVPTTSSSVGGIGGIGLGVGLGLRVGAFGAGLARAPILDVFHPTCLFVEDAVWCCGPVWALNVHPFSLVL